MQYATMTFRVTGQAPLLMHNGQLADPLNHFSRLKAQISKKRGKTDADFQELARLEFLGSLYYQKTIGPGIPGELIEATLINAAKKSKKGQQAKAGLLINDFFPLEYAGPREPDEMWQTGEFHLTIGVKQQNNRIMRTRPMFKDWACVFVVEYLPDQLNPREIEDFVHTAGSIVGFGDWRPKYGRFTAEVV